MGDLYVHDKMKKCCAAALGKLDKARVSGQVASGAAPVKGGKGKEKGLQALLSSMTIPKATAAAQGLHDTGSELLRVDGPAKAVWLGIANKHRARHEGAGETMEGLFWQVLAAPLPMVDLSVHPEMADAFEQAAAGKKKFSGFGDNKKLPDKLKEATGGKIDFSDGAMFCKLGASKQGASYWLGVGKVKLSSSEKAAQLILKVPF